MFGVRKSNKWNSLILPILFEDHCRIGSHGQDHYAATDKLFIFIAQARQLRAAVRSHKAAQERQNHRLPVKVREPNAITLDIFQVKIGCQIPRGDQFTHLGAMLLPSPRYRRTSSRLIFLSGCFAGWDGKNKGSIRRSPVGRKRHEQI